MQHVMDIQAEYVRAVIGHIDYDYIVTPYQEKLAKWTRIPYPLFWFLVSAVLLGFHLSALKPLGYSLVQIWPHLVVGCLPFLIATSTIWFSKILEDFTPAMFNFISWTKEEVIAWNEREIRAIFSDKWMLISGIVLSVLLLPTVLLGPLWTDQLGSQITLFVMSSVITVLSGGLIYCMVRVSLMVHKLGTIKELKVSVYQHPDTSIRAIGKMMFRLSLTVLLIYFFSISYQLGSQGSLILLSIRIFFGLFVLCFFIYPQINVHRIMSSVKQRKLMNFSDHLEKSLTAVTKDPSSDNIQRVRELFEIQRSLNGMGEWPFNTKLLLTIITGIAFPVIVVILQLICSKLLAD